ncbi:hypothetical protein OKW76_15225 [Sphingomonas sp. S1-29]|uniref:Uncharacterized protein n=1 Tax=Sphingomonas qomolangmaensis TaxID=2918765 RepID=A0ABY5LAN3_9SPHN|nr:MULTISPECIES: hypothetical protein [Sphingomonas]UUL82860.1 hypothetical protein NMP03_01045 [Sphingomonas qomolangmaensis]UZK69344.1 hypothetical protein OKW76_15225 [Sphingomonas sp. S1-29]
MMKKTALLGLMALAACSAEPETGPPPSEAVTDEAPAYVEPEPLPEPAPLPEPSPEPTPTEEPEPIAPDEQMLDDAEATGMTSRVDRSEDGTTQEEVPVRE